MGGYLGPQPVPQAVIHKQRFPLASGQTSVATAGYIPGYVNAWLNGQRLDEYDDFTATNGSDVVLTVGGGADGLDVLIIEALVPFQVLNQYFTGTTKVDTLNVLGGATFSNGALTVLNTGSNHVNIIAKTESAAGHPVFQCNNTVGDWDAGLHGGNQFNIRDRAAGFLARLSIDSAGRVTMPYQPVFAAHGGTWTNGSDLVFNTTTVNVGNSYNASNGRFTAPVSGKYLISAQLFVNVTGTTQANLNINGGGSIFELKCNTNEGGYQSVGATKVVPLSAGDYLALRATIGGVLMGEPYTFFSGHLIG